ncbi:alpha/beta hydrolase family protein [Micromonospora eburnea]|uniref:Alpha/beta hydrolase family protein n=1 Tax=Micromonospora eburnea TaxID=227316 RepID=A0A1C6TVJ9_9ACTN|nr:alpha/beta fold hydrolase [Micromonospora eburnea]SCL45795.1 Alpha/beta hydrolase family protein [Micromonospora eburnea]
MKLAALRLIAVALSVGMVACSADPPPPTQPTGLNAGSGCPEFVGDGRQVEFGKEIDAELGGIVLGSGATGVVLAHMAAGDVCQWLPFGRTLADRGYRVLAFDFAGNGVSRGHGVPLARQVEAAASALRADGASRIVLAGGSMGGAAVLAATPTLSPPPVAVIALSSPSSYQDADAAAAAPKITAPVLYGAGELEPSFSESARQMYAATPQSTQRQLVLVPTSAHGVNLLGEGGSVEIRDRVTKFLDTYAPPA